MRIACFGDSLTEGYGVAASDALPAVLQGLLEAEGVRVRCLNFGVSGDTTFDGLRRLDHVLAAEPDAVILEFGANDAFMSLDPAEVRANLARLAAPFLERDVPVLLVGITAIDELGADYRAAFDPIFTDLAMEYGLALFPDILAPFYEDPGLKLMDMLHPNEAGIRAVARAMLPLVRGLVRDAEGRSARAARPA